MSRKRGSKKKIGKGSTSKDGIMVAPIVMMFLIIVSLLFFIVNNSNQNEIDLVSSVEATDPPPGTNESLEELDMETTNTTYSCNDTLDYVNELDTIENLTSLNNTKTDIDPNDNPPGEYSSTPILVEDNRFCYTYFQYRLNWGNLLVRVEADTQYILYVTNSLISNGDVSIRDAEGIADDILEEFAYDLRAETADVSEEIDIYVTNEEDPSNGADTDTTITGYHFVYIKEQSNVESSDRVTIIIDSDGNLRKFSRIWNLDLPTDVTPSLTDSEALQAASTYLDDPTGYVICELMIVRPNHFWLGSEVRYGFDDGILSWVITEYTDENYDEVVASVWVDADEDDGGEGDIIGGYC